jgi:nucleoside-diphosphate kinase
MERTLVIIKPDAIERRLMGEIISIYEKRGFRIAAAKMLKPTPEIAARHYQEHKGKPFFERLINYITRGEICVLILEGANVISAVRRINGATDPLEADAGSIRGRYALSKTENTVHSSDSLESAEAEIKVWFPELI